MWLTYVKEENYPQQQRTSSSTDPPLEEILSMLILPTSVFFLMQYFQYVLVFGEHSNDEDSLK